MSLKQYGDRPHMNTPEPRNWRMIWLMSIVMSAQLIERVLR
jgi:hypothetical protein